MRPKVSVVVPVYNTAPYLRRCLDSVCGQTLREIEILCVNDASPDNSLEILHEYCQADARVKIFDLEQNLGEAGARNFALRHAHGVYVGFVDSDDYVDNNFYEKLYARAAVSDVDIVKGSLREFLNGQMTIKSAINKRIPENKYFFLREFSTAIYRKGLLRKHNIAFLQGAIYGTDLAFLIQAVTKADTVYVIDDVYYNYCRYSDSTDSSSLNLKKIQSIIYIVNFIVNYINRHCSDIDGYIITFNENISRLKFSCQRVDLSERDAASRLIAENLLVMYSKCKHKNIASSLYFSNIYASLQAGNLNEIVNYLRREISHDLRLHLQMQNKRAM
jgi:glycosyltransferase involved in cell wall biosynthesis